MNWLLPAWHGACRSISMAGGAGLSSCLLSPSQPRRGPRLSPGLSGLLPARGSARGSALWGKAEFPRPIPALGGHPSKGCADACFTTIPYIKYHSCRQRVEPTTSCSVAGLLTLCHDEAAEPRDLLQPLHAAGDVTLDPGTTSDPVDPPPQPQPLGPSLGMETTGASRCGSRLQQARC